MRHRGLWLLCLTGCVPAFSGSTARPNALACAEAVAGSLGYQLVSESQTGGLGSFTAEKALPPELSHPTMAELTVSVWGGRDGERIRASADRYEVAGSLGPATIVPVAAPRLPPSLEDDRPRARQPRPGRRKLSPGPIAADARLVLHECAVSGAELNDRAAFRPT